MASSSLPPGTFAGGVAYENTPPLPASIAFPNPITDRSLVHRADRIIVVGTSAGGVEALKQVVRELPMDFPAALLVVLHLPPRVPRLLGAILDRCGTLPAVDASDGLRIQAGHIYVGVPGHHLLVDGDRLRLSRAPAENRFRPSIDALFRSAADALGSRVVGVVLTGQLHDGASGLRAIKDRGGVTVVQSPADAQYPSMPLSALQHVDIDHVSDLSSMPQLLIRLAQGRSGPREFPKVSDTSRRAEPMNNT